MTTGKIILLLVIVLLAGFLSGWFIGAEYQRKRLEDNIIRLEENNQQKENKILELLQESEKIDSIIIVKKETLKKIDTLWRIEKESLKYLPLDSSVSLLRKNLESYEWENCE